VPWRRLTVGMASAPEEPWLVGDGAFHTAVPATFCDVGLEGFEIGIGSGRFGEGGGAMAMLPPGDDGGFPLPPPTCVSKSGVKGSSAF
jgi:hypothetical protein